MKPRGIVLLPLLIIIVALAAVGTVGYFIWQANQGNTNTTNGNSNAVVIQNTNVNSNTNQATNSNVIVVNSNTTTNTNASNSNRSTAEWKTYTNSLFGYSIRYPSDWKVTDTNILHVTITPPGEDDPNRVTPNPSMRIDIINPPDTLSNPVSVELGGVTAQQGIISGYIEIFATQFKIDNDNLQIAWAKTNKYGATLNEMLTTIQFTQATSGLRTFINKRYGWSVQYPVSWTINNDTDDEPEVQLFLANGGKTYEIYSGSDGYATLEDWRTQVMRYKDMPNAQVETSETTVDGLKAFRIDTNLNRNTSYIGVMKGSVVVTFIGADNEIPDQLLSTFQFTD